MSLNHRIHGSRFITRLGGLLGIVALSVVAEITAASSYQGYVGNVVQEPGSAVVYIEITNGNWGGNSCGASTFWVLVSSAASTAASTLALALEAKATGNSVYVAGDGVCSSGAPNGGISEGLSTFYLD